MNERPNERTEWTTIKVLKRFLLQIAEKAETNNKQQQAAAKAFTSWSQIIRHYVSIYVNLTEGFFLSPFPVGVSFFHVLLIIKWSWTENDLGVLLLAKLLMK